MQAKADSYQEESIRHESIPKHSPANPSTSTLSTIRDRRRSNCNNDSDKLVSRVRYQVIKLALGINAQKIPPQPQKHLLQENNHTRVAERHAQQLRLELPIQSRYQCAQQHVGCESHYGDVHVRAIDVFPWWEERGGAARGGGLIMRDLAGPGSVAPGEEDDEEFIDYVGVGDVEVVFEG
jgi:hypothetical protein